MAIEVGNAIQGIINFILSNLVAIVTLILTIIGIIGTPYYLRNKVSSAQQERYKQAKDSLLNLLEDKVINDRGLPEERINNLRSAIERRYSVSISDRISTIELLQDLQLRIEESKIDIEDKEEYSNKIQDVIEDYREERQIEDLPVEYQIAVQDLQSMDEITPQQIVEHIEEARRERQRESFESPFEVISIFANPGKWSELPPDARRRFYRILIVFGTLYTMFIAYFYGIL